jgi:hypothetical protein
MAARKEPTPPEQAYPARAAALRKAADQHEQTVQRQRNLARDLDNKWAEYRATRQS